MSVNAEAPQVRSGSLPTTTPRTIQRPATPQVAEGEQPAQPAAEGAQTAAEPAAKPKRAYKPRKPKAKLTGEFDLSHDEQAAWGRIALQALKAGVSLEKYIAGVRSQLAALSEEIAVFEKLQAAQTPAQAAEQPAETSEPAAA